MPSVQVYTKILLGMLVGALIGLLLGPSSSLLEADTYQVTAWERLDLHTSRDDSGVEIRLPSARRTQGKPVPLHLSVLEVVEEDAVDAKGETMAVPAWSRVSLPYGRELALRDKDGSIRRALGDPEAGDRVELWLEHERTPLEGGGFSVWPVPVSGLGDRIIGWLQPIGAAFMRLITMVIVPLVFSSLVVGVASLGDVRKLGRLGVRTLALYLSTTAAAVSIGLVCANLLQPGAFIDEGSRVALQAQFDDAAGAQVDKAAEAPSMIDNLLAIIPLNPVASLASGDMLQVIFFALLFGIALTLLDEERARPVVTFMDRVQEAMVVIIHVVMKVAPFGVAALVAEVVGTSGWSVLGGLLVYGLTVLVGLALHLALVYGALLKSLARLPLVDFLRAIRPAQLIAFSTSSSSATLPVSMECAEQNLGVSNPVASFVIPLGATVNMDGTALYQGVAAVFIAQVFQIDLGWGEQLAIVATATMASIGAAGVPGAGMVTLAMVLTATGIPTVGVALILGMDRLLDMFRTAVNVTGDLVVTASMARSEGETLRVLTVTEDRADPGRRFERRLERHAAPVEPEQ